MKNPNGGRPVNYTKEQLQKALLQYVKDNPGRTIKMSELEKATGIKRYVWNYNMRDEIDKINREIQRVETARTGICLPTVEQIMLSCKGNEEKLAEQLQTLLDMVADMSRYQDAAKAGRVMKRDYENKLEELECIIKEKDKKIESLYEELNKLAMDSENPNTRKEKGIKNNIIEFTPQNIEAFKSRAEKLLL